MQVYSSKAQGNHIIVLPGKEYSIVVPAAAAAAAGTQSFFWCPDSPLLLFQLPSSAAPLHRAGAHNAQMVAIVWPCPLPHRRQQEALLYARGTGSPADHCWTQWKAQEQTQGYMYVYRSLA